jgi:hypothetical protein
MLSSYISAVIKKGLRFIRENNKNDDKEDLLSQIKACNPTFSRFSFYRFIPGAQYDE